VEEEEEEEEQMLVGATWAELASYLFIGDHVAPPHYARSTGAGHNSPGLLPKFNWSFITLASGSCPLPLSASKTRIGSTSSQP
jgi:hypothetical protein